MPATRHPSVPRAPSGGFTLIEVMVTVAIVAILASIALPSYTAYLKRGRVPAALTQLNAYYARMEQRFQDNGTYVKSGACALAVPTDENFNFTCTATADTFKLTASGKGSMTGFEYTIDSSGQRATTQHPKGTNANCWTSKGGSQCDS